MIYQGNAITVERRDTQGGNDIAMLTFDLKDESVNKLSSAVMAELGDAVKAIQAESGLKGLMIRSGKDAFIVGADITEFHSLFDKGEEYLVEMNLKVHDIFNAIEDLPFPTVTAINGLALGGGCEVLLTTDFRVMSEKAKIGLPETKLGILPGWGGCVRLPRLIGADNAVEWIAGGTENRADAALKVGAVDAAVAHEQLEEAALDILDRANAGELDYHARREEKKSPLKLNAIEQMMRSKPLKDTSLAKRARTIPPRLKPSK